MVDFTKSNRWKTFVSHMKTPTENMFIEHFEVLEQQLIALEAVVYALKKKVETDEEESHG